MRCPHCNNNAMIFFKENWSKKHYDFACGGCKMEIEVPKTVGNYQKIIDSIYNFDYIQLMEEKTLRMTAEELEKRLNELDNKLK